MFSEIGLHLASSRAAEDHGFCLSNNEEPSSVVNKVTGVKNKECAFQHKKECRGDIQKPSHLQHLVFWGGKELKEKEGSLNEG